MRFLPGFYDVFDDMFDDGWMSPSTNAMQCDIKEVDNNYEMNIALPGYKKEDISLDLTDGYLTVSANTNQDKEEKDKKIQRRHRWLVIKVCKLSVHKVLLFQKKYWYKMYSKMSVEGFEKLIEEFRNECNNER